jgi:hypothetical protein
MSQRCVSVIAMQPQSSQSEGRSRHAYCAPPAGPQRSMQVCSAGQ